MDINPFSEKWANMFSHFVGCLFILLMISFAVQKLFSLTKSHLFIFSFVSLAWEIYLIKYCYEQCLRFCCLCILLQFFMVWGLTFKFLIHFEFILVCSIRRWSSFIVMHVSVQFSQHHLLNKLSLAHCMCLFPLLNINLL